MWKGTFVEIYENTHAIALYPRLGGGAEVEVVGGRIRASRVILALNGLLPRLDARWAMGEEDRLLAVARSLEKPGLLPPDPILRIGVGWRFARGRAKASAEL